MSIVPADVSFSEETVAELRRLQAGVLSVGDDAPYFLVDPRQLLGNGRANPDYPTDWLADIRHHFGADMEPSPEGQKFLAENPASSWLDDKDLEMLVWLLRLESCSIARTFDNIVLATGVRSRSVITKILDRLENGGWIRRVHRKSARETITVIGVSWSLGLRGDRHGKRLAAVLTRRLAGKTKRPETVE